MTKHETPKAGHNSSPLPDYIRRIEEMNLRIQDDRGDIKEIYSELKSKGFAPAVVRALIKKRAADQKKLQEFNDLLEIYEHSIQLLLPLED